MCDADIHWEERAAVTYRSDEEERRLYDRHVTVQCKALVQCDTERITMLSDNGTVHPAISTEVICECDYNLFAAPKIIASDLPGLRQRPFVNSQLCKLAMYKRSQYSSRLVAETYLFIKTPH